MSEPTWLTEIEERVRAATPGPWMVSDAPYDEFGEGCYHEINGLNWTGLALVVTSTSGEGPNMRGAANAALIAHSPTDITRLIAEYRKVREALEPFARAAKYAFDGNNEAESIFTRGDHAGNDCRSIRVGDLVRARAALTQDEER